MSTLAGITNLGNLANAHAAVTNVNNNLTSVNNFADAIYSNSAFYEAYYARGICFETLGNIAQAEVDYKRSVEINPNYIYAARSRAMREADLVILLGRKLDYQLAFGSVSYTHLTLPTNREV